MVASTAITVGFFDEVSPLFPLHVRVRKTIERLIVEGKWESGMRVTSSRQMSELLGVSRTTIQTAYDELIDDGFLRAVPRSGVFVNTTDQPMGRTDHSGDAPDWHERVRPLATLGLPHLSRRQNWHEYDYPFITGQHDPGHFPDRDWLTALRRALGPKHRHASLDDTLMDDVRLVSVLCSTLLPARGLFVKPENVMITLGSQEALSLLADCLVSEGDVVAVEDPGYVDARHVFASRGARIHPVPVDDEGISTGSIPPETTLCFVTPSHQHPTNRALSADRRLELIELAVSNDFIIVEDDYDSELRYRGRPLPAMASLDSSRVVYLGSVSKVLAPGLRIGFVVGDPRMIETMRWHRRYRNRQVPGHSQRALALLLDSGSFSRSLQAYRRELSTRWQIATTVLQEEFDIPSFPAGGTALWLPLPDGVRSSDLVISAEEQGILIDPGRIYFANPADGEGFIRVGFSCIPTDHVEPGLRKLARLIKAAEAGPPPETGPGDGAGAG